MSHGCLLRFVVCSAGVLLTAFGAVITPASATEPKAKPAERYSLRDTLRGQVFDESGKPMAGVQVSDPFHRLWGRGDTVITDRDGRFQLGAKPGHWRSGSLLARTPNREWQSILQVEEEHPLPRRVSIVLKPARKILVSTVDGHNKPVSGATVEVMMEYSSAAIGMTDPTGHVELWFPADGKVDWIIALKDDAGFDYFENYAAFPTQERGIVPDELQLVLDGARQEIVTQAKDDQGKPVPGVRVTPWALRKPGKISYANVSGSHITSRSTDDQGQARFRFLPGTNIEGFSFLANADSYHSTDGLHIEAGDNDPLEIELKPNGTIRGTLKFADGSPAPQILLQAEGDGAPHYFRGFARSDDEGNYSFNVYADQIYTINVLDDEWAAASHTGESVKLGDKPHEVNFDLIPGTLIEGTLTIGTENAPAAGATATLTQEPQFVRWSTADDEGHYKFRVGPGAYTLILPHGMEPQEVVVNVTNQNSIVHHAHALRKERDQMEGDVHRASDGTPVAGARIFGESIETPGHAGFHTVTDAAGHFKTERWLDCIFVIARDTVDNQAGMALIAEDDKACKLKVTPAARIAGRVVDENGKPIAKARVQCSTWLPAELAQQTDEDKKKPAPSATVNYTVYTEADGTFSVPAIPVGAKSGVFVSWNDRQERSQEFAVKEAQEFNTGDIVLKPPPADAPK